MVIFKSFYLSSDLDRTMVWIPQLEKLPSFGGPSFWFLARAVHPCLFYFELFCNVTFQMGRTSVRKWIADFCCSFLGYIHVLFTLMAQKKMYTKISNGDCSSVYIWLQCGYSLECDGNKKELLSVNPADTGSIHTLYLTL